VAVGVVVVADQAHEVVDRFEFRALRARPGCRCSRITRLHNTGAAFSFLATAGGWQRWFFITIAVAVTRWSASG
jgi:signal peptidase II